ncbi:MAG: hypothetical protein ACR2Q3_14420, partial [Woeseiaceae bacterium]
EGSNVRAQLNAENIPRIDGVDQYIQEGCIPGGTERNFASYGEQMQSTPEADRALLCDPQTSGGLLTAVSPVNLDEFERCVSDDGLALDCIGELLAPGPGPVLRFSQWACRALTVAETRTVDSKLTIGAGRILRGSEAVEFEFLANTCAGFDFIIIQRYAH